MTSSLLSKLRSSTILHLPSPQLRSLSILSPSSSTTPLTSHQKSKSALSLLKSESDPTRILQICREAALSPSTHLDRLSFSTAIQTLSKSKHYQTITTLLSDLITKDETEHAIVLYGQANMLEQSLRLFENGKRTVKSLNAVLFACLIAKDYKEAKRVYIEYPKVYKIEPDLDTYNKMIRVFSESGSSSSCYSVIAEMERKGVKPNKESFSVMISGFYKEEKEEEVGKVLAMMRERGVSVGVSIYNVRILSLCKRGKVKEAKALFDGMEMKANSVTYGCLIHGFCYVGELEEAKRLFKGMGSRGLKADSECYFTLVYYLCKGGEFEAALGVCEESMEKNWVPSFGVMKSLVNGLAGEGKVEEAKKVIGKVKEKFSKNVELWDEVEAALPQ